MTRLWDKGKICWNPGCALLPFADMGTTIRKAVVGTSKQSAQQDVRSELKAIEAAFKRASKNAATAILFLSKAGIVTKRGRLAKEYR